MGLILYHGTSLTAYKGIQSEGLRNPYLTNSEELAEYYAECANGQHTVVLKVFVNNLENLKVDYPSLAEPVGFGKFLSSELEENVDKLYRELDKNNQELKDSDYEVCLKTVGTCKYEGIISPEYITLINFFKIDEIIL